MVHKPGQLVCRNRFDSLSFVKPVELMLNVAVTVSM